jgi:proteasome lid subunit RPN8/RPN11
MQIEISKEIMESIEKHAFSRTDIEVGGVLIGAKEEKNKIIGSLPALKTKTGQTSVTFTHETWSEILPQAEKKFPNGEIVGWYHTHPGFGIFLSEYDLFIQENFFSSKHQLALVIDPLAAKSGWFAWVENKVTLVKEFETINLAKQRPKKIEISKGKKINALVASLATLILGLGIGWGFGNIGSATNVSDRDIEMLIKAKQDLEFQNQILVDQINSVSDSTNGETAKIKGNYLYTVKAGDTLWNLALRFYEDGARHPEISKANSEVKELSKGIVIKIPIEIEFTK